jgi:hypothetical protein
MRDLVPRYVNGEDTVVVEEMGLRHGASRIDVAVINGSIHGMEIKGERDSLRRLPHQIDVYGSVLDEVTLIVAVNHLAGALRLIPEWWGVVVAERASQSHDVELRQVRAPFNNPFVNPLALVRLLWREEAVLVLAELGSIKAFLRKPRAAIYERIVELAPYEFLHTRVCEKLKTRTGWRSVERQA